MIFIFFGNKLHVKFSDLFKGSLPITSTHYFCCLIVGSNRLKVIKPQLQQLSVRRENALRNAPSGPIAQFEVITFN